MKTLFKKLSAVAVVLTMILVLAVPGFAANAHTFALYQIFTGDYSNGKLTNVAWGASATGEGSAEDAAAAITAGADATAAEKYIKDGAEAYMTVTAGQETAVPNGYYVAKDVTTLEKGDAYSSLVVEVSNGTLTLNPKNNTAPTFNKKTFDINDSSQTALGSEMVKYDESGWQDSADFDIGDSVPMRLEGTIPSDIADYAHYYYAFHDVMEQGLTFEKIENVYVNGTALPADAWTCTTEGSNVTIVIKDIKPYANAGDKVDVYYTAVLNTSAHNGTYGNVNDAYLEYSASPEDTTSPDDSNYPTNTNTTEKDSVIVFTYNLVINKVDNEGNALAGATFELYKKMADGTEKQITLTKNDAGTIFTAVGIDDGDYILKETAAPAGYNAIKDLEFTVTASHNVVWEGTDRTSVLTELAGGDTFTGNVANLELTGNIVNKTGAELPTTGGIGTVIFYVAGAILVLAAGVLIFTKWRVAKDN